MLNDNIVSYFAPNRVLLYCKNPNHNICKRIFSIFHISSASAFGYRNVTFIKNSTTCNVDDYHHSFLTRFKTFIKYYYLQENIYNLFNKMLNMSCPNPKQIQVQIRNQSSFFE